MTEQPPQLEKEKSDSSGNWSQQFLTLLLKTNTFKSWFIRGTLLTTGGLLLFILLHPNVPEKIIVAYYQAKTVEANDTPYLITNKQRIIDYTRSLDTDLTLLYAIQLEDTHIATLVWSNHTDASDALDIAPGSLLALLNDPQIRFQMDENNCYLVQAAEFNAKLSKVPGRGALCPIRRKGKISAYVFLLFLRQGVIRTSRPVKDLSDAQVLQAGNSLATFIEGLP